MFLVYNNLLQHGPEIWKNGHSTVPHQRHLLNCQENYVNIFLPGRQAGIRGRRLKQQAKQLEYYIYSGKEK